MRLITEQRAREIANVWCNGLLTKAALDRVRTELRCWHRKGELKELKKLERYLDFNLFYPNTFEVVKNLAKIAAVKEDYDRAIIRDKETGEYGHTRYLEGRTPDAFSEVVGMVRVIYVNQIRTAVFSYEIPKQVKSHE